MAEHDTNQEFKDTLNECRNLFAKKLHDYGASWRILRPSSLTDQLFIKARRIRDLETTGKAMIDEGIRPEFIGLVNYGIIGLIQLAHPSVLAPDMEAAEALDLYRKNMLRVKRDSLQVRYDALCGTVRVIHKRQAED